MITKEDLINTINNLDISGTTWLLDLMNGLIPIVAQVHNLDADKLRAWIDLRSTRKIVMDLIQDSLTLSKLEEARIVRNSLCFCLNDIFSNKDKFNLWEDKVAYKLKAESRLDEEEKAFLKQAMIEIYSLYLETFDVVCKSSKN